MSHSFYPRWWTKILLLSSILLPLCTAIQFQNTRGVNLARSRLVLFRGKDRVEVEGKTCPVGITFTQPQRFSCACVTGVWAFYDEWCAPPFRVIGGVNHCFEMPSNWVQQVTLWSNPIKVLDSTLTIFDGEEEYIKAKIYRNTHITVTNVSAIVTHDSTWTLTSQRDGKRICLNSQVISGTGGAKKLPGAKSNSVFCHFEGMSEYLQEIKGFKPGCAGNDTRIEPTRCQHYESKNDEKFCTSPELLDTFAKSMEAEEASHISGQNRTVRPFRKRDRARAATTTLPTTSTTEAPSTTTISITTTPEVLKFDDEMFTNEFAVKEAVIRGKKQIYANPGSGSIYSNPKALFLDFPWDPLSDIPQGINMGNALLLDFPGRSDGEEGLRDIAGMIAEMKNINESEWLTPNKSESDPFFLIQIWMYQKQAILTSLNLKREEELVVHAANQVGMLLNISKEIMQKTCTELINPEFFDMAMEAFLNVQRKNIHWKLPFIDHADFMRIQSSLTNCLARATNFTFKTTTGCLIKDPVAVYLNGVEKPLVVPDKLNSEGFEPIIETMWKVIVNAHSYCYSDFSQSYNDHHRYTVMFTPIFTNAIHDIWHRNKTIAEEYSGVAGKLNLFLKEVDKCTVASRYVSIYPWDLARPLVGDGSEKRRRRKRSAIRRTRRLKPSTTTEEPVDPEVLRQEKLAKEEAAWKKSRLIMKGLGYCLKKFDEPRLRLGQVCEETA